MSKVNWNIILGIAKTHLLTRFKQTSIAALGVTFGIGSYITLVCFMTGLNMMLDDLILNQTPHIHVYNEIEPSKKQPIDLYQHLEDAINIVHSIKPKYGQLKVHNAKPIITLLNDDPEVKGAIPQVKAQIFYVDGSIELGGNLIGINPMEEARLFNLDNYIVEGSASILQNTKSSIIIGSGVADKLSLKLNDRIQINTIDGGVFPLKIVGIYQSGLAEIDAIQSFTNLKTVQTILGETDNYITDINIKLNNIELAPEMASRIEKQFGVKAIDINTANAQFETGTSIRNMITYAVSITLLIVAGFGIYNILNMLIYEKMNDIAILKATGFSGRDVQLIFISQAMLIGVIGGVFGLLVGLGLSHLIDNLPFKTEALPTIKTFPVNIDSSFFIIGIVFAMISTFLAGFLPARKAKNIDPVKIIRGQ